MNDNALCNSCGLLPQLPVQPKPAPVCKQKKKCCPKKDCCGTEFAFRKVLIPAALGDDITGEAKPEIGAYTNSYVEYEANGAQYMYDSYGVYTKIAQGEEGTLDFNELINRPKYAGVEMTSDTDIPNLSPKITALQGAVQDEKEARIAADTTLQGKIDDEEGARKLADSGLQTQIDALAASSDVTDIVGTYAELEAYDTQHLKDNDIIKVLQDETHDDETTYYRWSTSTEEFSLIGEEGPYYTKAAADQKFQDKLTAGAHISIDADNEISANYTHFTGATALTDGTAGLVPAPVAGDEDKALKGDGTWGSVSSQTIFYANLNETGNTRHIYKDIDFTTAASAQDIIDANGEGQVILRGTSLVNPTAYSDSYLQNAFIMPHNSDYEFVFLDRDLRHEYTASATTDTAFYYDTSEIQPKLTAGSNVQITGTTISATDTTYSNFTGTDGVDAGAAGLVPAPATTDAGKYLKADGTWGSVSAGPTVVQTTGTSQTDVMSQNAVSRLIYPNGSQSTHLHIAIGESPTATSTYGRNIAIGYKPIATGKDAIAIGSQIDGDRYNSPTASGGGSIAIGHRRTTASQAGSIAIGGNAKSSHNYSIALGASANGQGSETSRENELSIGYGTAGDANEGTRYIAHVKNPQRVTDAANKRYVDTAVAGTSEALTIADTDWTALSASDPYDYSATVTATTTISATSTVELINDQAVLFGNHGFAIGSVDTTNNTVTIYSIGAPSASVSLTIKVRS